MLVMSGKREHVLTASLGIVSALIHTLQGSRSYALTIIALTIVAAALTVNAFGTSCTQGSHAQAQTSVVCQFTTMQDRQEDQVLSTSGLPGHLFLK